MEDHTISIERALDAIKEIRAEITDPYLRCKFELQRLEFEVDMLRDVLEDED